MASVHGCRWEWCRAVFGSHGDLVDHIKLEHLIRMRPMTRKDAAGMLRTEGFTPEEIAARLIPGYEPTPTPTQSITAPINDPPHQAPASSPPTPNPPPPAIIEDKEFENEPPQDQPIATEPPETQVEDSTAPSTKSPGTHIDRDGDIAMPPSSPPRASPTPSPKPASPVHSQAGDMSIDQPEDDTSKTTTDFLVPVSSPPASAVPRASSVGSRTPRLKRRSSFSQLSSSPPDEFTALKNRPLPASPSMSTMIADREKEREKEREREKAKESVRPVTIGRRGSPVDASRKPRPEQLFGAYKPMRTKVVRNKFGLGRAAAQPGLQVATPGRKQLSATARQVVPGLRIESRVNRNEARQTVTPEPNLRGKVLEPQSDLDAGVNAKQTTGEHTRANSDDEDDEDIINDLRGNLDNPNLELETQAPYVSQTQSSYPSQTQTRAQ